MTFSVSSLRQSFGAEAVMAGCLGNVAFHRRMSKDLTLAFLYYRERSLRLIFFSQMNDDPQLLLFSVSIEINILAGINSLEQF